MPWNEKLYDSTKGIAVAAFIFILLQILLIMVPMETIGAPLQPFTRWGTARLDGDVLNDEHTIRAFINGSSYDENKTFHGDGSFSIICPGQDTDNEKCKNGGESGDHY